MGCRGSKRGVKRGPYKKRKPRRYHTSHKTTTKQGKREYQRSLMRHKLGVVPSRFGIRGPKPKRVLFKDLQADLKKLDQKVRRQIT